jgi:hypothetical protein
MSWIHNDSFVDKGVNCSRRSAGATGSTLTPSDEAAFLLQDRHVGSLLPSFVSEVHGNLVLALQKKVVSINNGHHDQHPSTLGEHKKTLLADHVVEKLDSAHSRRRRVGLFKLDKNSCMYHFFQAITLWWCTALLLYHCRPVVSAENFDNDVSLPLPDVLTDTPNVVHLKDWYLSSLDQEYSNLSAPGIVPGDVLSILLSNGIIQDPYHDRNFLTQRHIWMGGEKDPVDGNFSKRRWTRTWVYSTTFKTPWANDTDSLSWKVILESVKMGADVLVNGIKIGEGQCYENGLLDVRTKRVHSDGTRFHSFFLTVSHGSIPAV